MLIKNFTSYLITEGENIENNMVTDDKVIETPIIGENSDVVNKEFLENSELEFVNVRRSDEKSMIRSKFNKALKFNEFVVNRDFDSAGYNIIYGTNDLNGDEFHLIYDSSSDDSIELVDEKKKFKKPEGFVSKAQQRFFYAVGREDKKMAKLAKEKSKATDYSDLPESVDENHDGDKFDLVNYIIDYENGDLSFLGTIELFSNLIKSGKIKTLQGHYGKSAEEMINNGLFDDSGNINKDNIVEFMKVNNIELEDGENIDNIIIVEDSEDVNPENKELIKEEDSDEDYEVSFVYRGKNGLVIYKSGDYYTVYVRRYDEDSDEDKYDSYDNVDVTFGMHNIFSDKSLDVTKKELNSWKLLDESTQQYVKKYSDDKYEFVQYVGDEIEPYNQEIINISDYNDEQMEESAKLCYDDLETLKSIHSNDWKMYLCKCIFESETK